MMKLVVLLMTVGGLGLALWLVLTNDTGAILAAFAAVGWGLGAIILVRLFILYLCGSAWALLLRRPAALPLSACRAALPLSACRAALPLSAYLSVRFIREAINVMLPVATVGGDIVGARLITFWGLAAGLAGASILVDLLLQASGQAVFAAAGALLLAQVAGAETLVGWVLSGVAVAAAGLLGFYLAQRFGGVDLVERAIARLLAILARSGAVGRPIGLDAGLRTIWADPVAVAWAFVLHILAWFAGVLEIWIALAAMGHPGNLLAAMIIESLGQALRGAAFPVPGALGVQEGGFVVLGHLLGIDPETAIALSLVKRVPDVVLGLPGLLGWHWLESRRGAMAPAVQELKG